MGSMIPNGSHLAYAALVLASRCKNAVSSNRDGAEDFGLGGNSSLVGEMLEDGRCIRRAMASICLC